MRALARRLIALVPVLLGLSVLTHALLAMVPGDRVVNLLGLEATPESIATLRARYALDQPLPLRFLSWLGYAMTGDLGRSIQTGRPVLAMVGAALVPTLQLAGAALLASLLIALPAGVAAATRRGRVADAAASLVALAGLSLPSFWLGILLILAFSIHLPWLPSSGYVPFTDAPLDALRHLVLPALTLGAALAAATMRRPTAPCWTCCLRSSSALPVPRGLPNRRVVWRHALRPALVPIVTLVGVQLGQLLGGVVVTETVSAWPGIGKLIVDAIFARDCPVMQGAILVTATLFVLVNVAADTLCLAIDPRTRAIDGRAAPVRSLRAAAAGADQPRRHGRVPGRAAPAGPRLRHPGRRVRSLQVRELDREQRAGAGTLRRPLARGRRRLRPPGVPSHPGRDGAFGQPEQAGVEPQPRAIPREFAVITVRCRRTAASNSMAA